jgi:hypothetical protein
MSDDRAEADQNANRPIQPLMTQSGPKPGRNPAAQQSPAVSRCAILLEASTGGAAQ